MQQLWPFDIACLRPTTSDGTQCLKRHMGPRQADALHQFVEKEEKGALADCLSASLAATLSVSMANEETADAIDRGLDLSALLRQAAAQRRTQLVTTFHQPQIHHYYITESTQTCACQRPVCVGAHLQHHNAAPVHIIHVQRSAAPHPAGATCW
jgi:hypothetical protein